MEAHGNGPHHSVEVELRGLSIYTHHGVSEAEREIGQRLDLDVSFDVPDCDALLTDRIEDTVDYGEVADIVALAATERSYRTLERLCHVICERLAERFRLRVGDRARGEAGAAAAAGDRGGGRRGHPGGRRGRDRRRRRRGGRGLSRTGYLGLGSNVGDRAEHLRAAIELLPQHGVSVDAVSSAYETEPVGEILDQPDFLNAAARMATELEPEELLDVCKAIEAERGRMFAGPRHGPRPLDLDVLLLGDLEHSSERLTIPHPQVSSRRFVLVPLLELDPELTLPDGTALGESSSGSGRARRFAASDPCDGIVARA